MERIQQGAFITAPMNKNPINNNESKANIQYIKNKILVVLKQFTDAQLLSQAIKNIGIPKKFIDSNYYNGKCEQEMSTIYSAICVLKRQIVRINRHSQLNIISSTYQKINKSNKEFIKKQKDNPNYIYLKWSLSPQQRIKYALQRQLYCRNKIDKREEKCQHSQKLKQIVLDKKRNVAKNLNKKAGQIYFKQKQKQQRQFDEILQKSKQKQQVERSDKSQHTNSKVDLSLSISNYPRLAKKTSQQKAQYQNFLLNEQQIRKSQETTLLKQRQKKKSLIYQKIILKQQKQQQILLRKQTHSHQQQLRNIKSIITKEQNYKQQKNIATQQITKDKDKDQKNQTFYNTCSSFRNSTTGFYGNLINFQQSEEKENLLKQRLTNNTLKRQQIINQKIYKIRQKNERQKARLQRYKLNKQKLLAEQTYHLTNSFYNKKPLKPKSTMFLQNVQQQNIKQKHKQIEMQSLCDQAIIKLRKLPTSQLIKKSKHVNKARDGVQQIVRFVK